MEDPYYNRRLKGTPARKFINKTSGLIIGIGAIIGVGFHLMSLAVKGSSPYKDTVSKYTEAFEEIMSEKSLALAPIALLSQEPTESDNISTES